MPDSTKRNLQWEQLAEYISQLERHDPQAHLIIGADLNARVGDINDPTFTDLVEEMDLLPPDCWTFPRSSKDLCLNEAGTLLTRLSLHHNITWLNGLQKFKTASEFTYISSRGCSVIDYFLISIPLYPFVVNFEIVDFKLSDHLPLSLSLNLKIARTSAPIPETENSHLLPKLVWKETTLYEIHQLLKKTKAINLRSNIFIGNDPNKIISAYDELVHYLVLNISQPLKENFTNSEPLDQGWFDAECRSLKNQLRKAFSTFRATNSREHLKNFFLLKKQFDDALHHKHNQFMYDQWSKLNLAATQKNSRIFWKIVSSSSRSNSNEPNLISKQQWLQHFSELFFL